MFLRTKTRTNTRGFSLLETVVAVSLIVGAVLGPVVAVTAALSRSAASRNKLIALHLGQEGIELVRTIRENNILCDILDGGVLGSHSWAANPETPAVNINGTYRISATDATGMSCASETISSPQLLSGTETPLRMDIATGIYDYTPSSDPTTFSRLMTIQFPVSSPDLGIPADHQLDISAIVKWTERDAVKSVTLKERLYYWR
jgi:Tfp pilus assembly protein PilV